LAFEFGDFHWSSPSKLPDVNKATQRSAKSEFLYTACCAPGLGSDAGSDARGLDLSSTITTTMTQNTTNNKSHCNPVTIALLVVAVDLVVAAVD
jgi:hypothetical protein